MRLGRLRQVIGVRLQGIMRDLYEYVAALSINRIGYFGPCSHMAIGVNAGCAQIPRLSDEGCADSVIDQKRQGEAL